MLSRPIPASRNLIRFLLYLTIAAAAVSGCVGLQHLPARPWSEALEYRTAHYTIRTNAGPEAAERISGLMEKALDAYDELLGFKPASLPPLLVNAYAAREEYERVARRLGFPRNITSGLYSPVPPAAIHLPYIHNTKPKPELTLLHEGLHQYVDRALRFLVPPPARGVLPLAQHKLVSLPLWLNEGLATYMESAATLKGPLQIGRINRERLLHLKELLKRRKGGFLKSVLSAPYGGPFGPEEYAVAWGVVYSLRHAPDRADEAERKRRLSQYIELSRQAFYEDAVAGFLRDFISQGKQAADFRRLWAEYIARRSLEAFKIIVVGQGATLREWEEDWVNRMLRLSAK